MTKAILKDVSDTYFIDTTEVIYCKIVLKYKL